MARALSASESYTIDRDINDVFDYVSDLTTMEDWVGDVSRSRLASGEGGTVGAVYEFDMDYRGETVPAKVEITELSRPDRIEMASIEGPFPYEGTMTFTPDSTGSTQVMNEITAAADGRITRVMFTAFKPILHWMMRRRLRAELEDLKSILERSD